MIKTSASVSMEGFGFLQWDLKLRRLETEKLLHQPPGISQEVPRYSGGVWALSQHAVQACWCTFCISIRAAKYIEESEVVCNTLSKKGLRVYEATETKMLWYLCQLLLMLEQVDLMTIRLVRCVRGQGRGQMGGRGGVGGVGQRPERPVQ